jgi:hypothetical protein
MTYANPTERAALIAGFRELAGYLESNPDVPVTYYADVYTFPPNAECAAERAEIDAVAARLGVTAHETIGGHYVALRSFGPVQYRAAAICHQSGHEHGNRKGATR